MTLKIFRLYFPAVAFFVIGLIFAGILYGFNTNAILQSVAKMAYLIPLLFIFFGLISAFWATYRSWQAENGVGYICDKCAGPLGRERVGRYGRYMKCMACNSNMSAKKYS